MCGIVGYTGRRNAAPLLLNGLKRLEYRGYDSVGIAVFGEDGKLSVMKERGRVERLERARAICGKTGIGHTRWATHGAPSAENAHPHVFGKFAVVHNGIVENDRELKTECLARGERFLSETDSEVIAHLLMAAYRGDFLSAVLAVSRRIAGSFAVAVLCSDDPDTVIAVKRGSPLVAGEGADGFFVASDVGAVPFRREITVLSDGEAVVLTREKIRFFGEDGKEIFPKKTNYIADACEFAKGRFGTYMEKEISEIPAAIQNTLNNFRLNFIKSHFCDVLCQAQYIHIVACGTAYHSGLAAKISMEALARIPVEVTTASEFRYRNPIFPSGGILIAVSQSGETADTIAAARYAKERGVPVLAVTNTPRSSLCGAADEVLYTYAGREFAVAATKSFCAQLAVFYALSLFLAQMRFGSAFEEEENSLCELSSLAQQAASVDVSSLVEGVLAAKTHFFLGRGGDFVATEEGCLKLKEIAYLNCCAYPAGEIKHGPLALVDRETFSVVLLSDMRLAAKTLNAVREVSARGGRVFLVTPQESFLREGVCGVMRIPATLPVFSPMLSVIPLQRLALFSALALGCDPDKPRNLAKSVTVE